MANAPRGEPELHGKNHLTGSLRRRRGTSGEKTEGGLWRQVGRGAGRAASGPSGTGFLGEAGWKVEGGG